MKLDRAKEHLSALDDEFSRFIARDPYRVEAQPSTPAVRQRFSNTEPPYNIIRINSDPPPRLSLILGDYVHNLRSALDHLIWELSASPDQISEFPIYVDASSYAAKEILRKAHGVPAGAWHEIVALQPCYRSVFPYDHPLWVIRCLDITDKHRSLLVAALGHSLVETTDTGHKRTTLSPVALKDGDPIFYRPATPSDESGVEVIPAYGVVAEVVGGGNVTLPLTGAGQLLNFVEFEALPRLSRLLR